MVIELKKMGSDVKQQKNIKVYYGETEVGEEKRRIIWLNRRILIDKV